MIIFLTIILAFNTMLESFFLPENHHKIPASMTSGISEEKFHQVIQHLENIYGPIVSEKGGRLIINRKWNNDIVNASTSRLGKIWYVNMYGGFARHPLMTEDAFSLVLCHEIGHHLGGAPRVGIISRGGFFGTWASVEGQSDYFGTLKCLRRLFKQHRKVISPKDIPDIVVKKCHEVWQNQDDVQICLRSSMAGFDVAKVIANLREVEPPRFDSEDPEVVESTSILHPGPQCRLDTFFQGALCHVDVEKDLSKKDETVGSCHELNGDTVGVRPKCWYRY